LVEIRRLVLVFFPDRPVQDENGIVREWGQKRTDAGLFNHYDLMNALEGIDVERGTKVAGGRGYFLRGVLRSSLSLWF
jgi:seryl-tRNA synthetase